MSILEQVRRTFNVQDLYEVLRISPQATEQEIKKAYFQRSLELHPDKSKNRDENDDRKEKFQILSEVHKILIDRESRKAYDDLSRQRSNHFRCEDSTIFEQIRLQEMMEAGTVYSYNCRCSGKFEIAREHISTLTASQETCCDMVIVDCDSCSNSIKVVI